MKKIFIALTSLLIVMSCSNDFGEIQKERPTEPILGKWQLIEIYQLNENGDPIWKKVENGEVIEFNLENKVLFSKSNGNTKNGLYAIDNIRLLLSYTDNEKYTENFMFENDHLILTPVYINCVLGCDKKYQRISN